MSKMNMSLVTQQSDFAKLTIARKYKDAMAFIDALLAQKVDPSRIMTEIISPTLQSLQKFDESPEASGYSSLTLLAIARICDDGIKKILPLMPPSTTSKGTVIIGTPKDDYHGLGKTIIGAFLRSYGWNVIDLGLNVDSKKFIEEAMKVNADFILVSAFLLPSSLKCKEIADYLHASPLNKKTLLIVGGPPFKFHLGLSQKLGCDGMGIDAFDAVRVLNSMKGYDKEAGNAIQKTKGFDKLKKRIFGLFRKEKGE
jgi:5-methyltetrahydrofolate--homocysteine methyltransferase